MKTHRSSAYAKFILYIFLGLVPSNLFDNYDNIIIKVIFLFVTILMFILILSVRCEKCNTLLYRYNKDKHGIFDIRLFFQAYECPVCHIKRGIW